MDCTPWPPMPRRPGQCVSGMGIPGADSGERRAPGCADAPRALRSVRCLGDQERLPRRERGRRPRLRFLDEHRSMKACAQRAGMGEPATLTGRVRQVMPQVAADAEGEDRERDDAGRPQTIVPSLASPNRAHGRRFSHAHQRAATSVPEGDERDSRQHIVRCGSRRGAQLRPLTLRRRAQDTPLGTPRPDRVTLCRDLIPGESG
jgi:hypothetical protein